MGAKDLHIAPIAAKGARAIVQRIHYSGKTVNNSQLHLGVFWKGKIEGAMQFGPPLDRRKLLGLVEGTLWNNMLELNRMAFSETLPRNSESRALAVAMRLIKKTYPNIEWVVSFADATQCGDGTIYRASGFELTGIKPNNQIWELPDGTTTSRMSQTDGRSKKEQARARKLITRVSAIKGPNIKDTGGASMKQFKDAGAKPLKGFQLRYIYFLNAEVKQRLTVPIIPFSRITELNAGMYKGKPREKQAMAGPPVQRRGSTDLHAPQLETA